MRLNLAHALTAFLAFASTATASVTPCLADGSPSTVPFVTVVPLAAGAGAVDAKFSRRNNLLYIANSGANTVSVFDPTRSSVVATIPVQASPRAIAIDDRNERVYTFSADGSVSKLDSRSNKFIASFSVDTNGGGLFGLSPQDIAFNPRTGRLYAVNAYTQIDIIDPSSQKVLKTIPDVDASNLAIDPNTNTIYVSRYFEGELAAIDGYSDQLVGVIADVGRKAIPSGCYQSAGGVQSCGIMASGLTRIVVDENLDRLYVLGQYDGRIVTIDGQSHKVIGKQFIKAGDYGLAVDSKAHWVFADNFASPAVWTMDGNTGQVVNSINLLPRLCYNQSTSCFAKVDLKSIALNPANGALYLVDQGDLNPQNASQLFIVDAAAANPSPHD